MPPILSSNYKMIVFDAGGTLISADWPAVVRDLTHEAAQQNLPVDADHVMEGLRDTWTNVISGTIQDTADSPEAVTRFWNFVLARALTLAAGLPMPGSGTDFDPRVKLAAQRFYPIFNGGRYHRLFDDTTATLQALVDAGFQVGLLSNWSPALPRVLERLKIDHFFDFAIVSASVRLAKPDPAIFDLAVQRSGFSPSELLYVGDSPAADIAGSRAAGWDAVLIARRDPSRHGDIEIPYQVSSLTELAVALGAKDGHRETNP